MEIKQLGLSQIRELYETRMREDFPPSELRPWRSIEELTLQGNYRCFGCEEQGKILAYAAFARCPEAALLDYYAVDAALRGQGIGQKFLGGLRDKGRDFGAPFVLLEVESVETAQSPQEEETRRRRIRFYEHCGCGKSGVYTHLFGVEYQIMYLPLEEGRPQDGDVQAAMEEIYRMIVTPLVEGDPERFSQACRVFQRG